jgi:hypothetical protein
MKKKIFIILTLVIVYATNTTPIFSEIGSTGWWIFRRPQSTKPRALTCVAAIRGDLSGVFYNPSILGTIEQREIFMISELGLAKDTFGGILYGMPIGKKSGLAAGVVYYDAGKETLYYMESGKTEPTERTVTIQRDILGMVSYGRKFTDFILSGLTVKFANTNIAEVKEATAFALDVGMVYFTKIDGLTISFVGQNIGSSTKFLNRSDELPMSVAVGSSYSMILNKRSYLNFGFETPYIIKEQRLLPSVGIEYGFEQVSINLGYRFAAQDSVFNFGIGISIKNFDIGYAFIPAVYLSPTHRLSIGYKFGSLN